MALINLIPGMGGATGALLTDSISLLENIAGCGPEDPFSCFLAIVDLAEVIYDVWTTFFPGRPKVGKDSASDDTALFFIPSPNPVIALWGMGIRDLEAQGIPTSASGGSGYAAQLGLAQAVLKDLQTQFDTPGAPTLTLKGVAATGQQVFDWYHLLGFQTSNPDSNRVAIAERQLVDSLYTQLVDKGWIDPKTGFPKTPPPQPPNPCPKGFIWDPVTQTCIPQPPPGHTCPAGYQWDTTQAKCVKIPAGQAKCPPGYLWDTTSRTCKPLPAPPPPGPGDPEQDEFQDCCDETQLALQELLTAVRSIQIGAGQTDCCDAVVAAIGSVTTQLARIVTLMPRGPASNQVDLARVAAAIAALTAAISACCSADNTLTGAGVKALEGIASAIADAPKTDVSGIVEQLKVLAREGDVKQSVLNYLTQQGFMSGADAQVIAGADWADAFTGIFRTWGWNALTWALSLVGITWSGKKFVLGSISAAITADIDNAVNDALRAGAAPLYPVVKGLVEGVVRQLEPATRPGLGNSGVDADALLAKTLAPTLIVNAVMLVASYLGWDSAEELREYVTLVSEFVGLVEVKEIQLGQRMQAGPIAAARLQAQKTYRQALPGAGEATGWHARGLVDTANARELLAFGGFEDALHGFMLGAAYGGINARQLIRLMATGLFTPADLTDEMTFGGLRPSSQHRLQLAAPYLATTAERSQLKSAIENAYSAGLLSDADLVSQIDSAEHNTDRDSLILERVHLVEQVAIAKALEGEYSTMYLAGLMTHDVYTANLSGMGLQSWKVNTLAGVADAKRAATQARQLTAAERALERATAAKERQVAMKSYVNGASNVVTLAAALVATGLTAAQAAAWTELAVLQKQGGLRWIYGQQLPAAPAALLSQRVAAVETQLKKQEITAAAAVRLLQDLKIPPLYINALIARWEAGLAGKSKTGLAVPLSTTPP